MKNYIEDLKKTIASRRQEEASIQSKIENAQKEIEQLSAKKMEALSKDNNEEYLSIYRKIQERESYISDLQVMLKDRQRTIVTNGEIIVAWDKTCVDFEETRRKDLEAYRKMKLDLAKMYVKLLQSENDVSKDYHECFSMGNFQAHEVHQLIPIQTFEARKQQANIFLKEECAEKLHVDLNELMMGNL